MADKNHAGYPSNSVTLVTNQIIKMLCFDATEPSNGNSDRRNYGNNRYIYSNLRQWLNSPAAAGQWYTAQHSADQTPDSSHVWNSVNPYSGLAGFLNAFTANERAALLNTTITVGKSSTDGGGTETCTDKIFPLSCTEVGLSGDHVCGSLYGSPIVWIVADKNHAGYPSNSVTLVTNQIIKMLCFDATEPSNGNSDRRNYGNNRYIYSNLRQWLNSPAAAGQWYTAQHSADQTPDSSHVWNSVNPYSGLAGFLNAFTANERAALLNTTITVGKSSTDGGGTETCTDKIFPLSCTEVGLSGDHVCGSKLAIFSDNNSRIATVTASCVANSNYSGNPGSGAAWYYWLRDAYAGSADGARRVGADGTLSGGGARDGDHGLRPACNLSSDLLISDSVDSDGCYTVIYNQAPTAPSSITVPSEVLGGENLSISWAASTDPDGNLSGYVLERKVGSGTWAQIYKGSARTYTDTITYGWTSVQYRVKAYDAAGAESAYTTSATRTVTNNRPPVISGTDGALGSFSTAAPSYEYTVTDADGHQVDVVEMLDGVTLRSYTVTLGHTNTLTIGSEAWLKVVNGSHTLKIVATDAKDASVSRTLTFTKAVTSVEFEQTLAMEADAMPTKALVNIQGNFPAGCTLQVWICNNGNDASPTWEDITQKARTGQKHYFTNKTKTAAAWGVKVKAKLLRGSATETCYIQSIGGNFA